MSQETGSELMAQTLAVAAINQRLQLMIGSVDSGMSLSAAASAALATEEVFDIVRRSAVKILVKYLKVEIRHRRVLGSTVGRDPIRTNRCGSRFGSVECGYRVNEDAAYTTCAGTIADCTLRGDDEVARNLPRLHPRRFDAFPGVPNQ